MQKGETMTEEVKNQGKKLKDMMEGYAKEDVCIAFSGGVDSSLLLKMACDEAKKTGKKVYAVTFDTKLHPSCDLEVAKKVAGELGGIHHVVQVDELEQEEIRFNPVNRCYLCKYQLFKALKAFARDKGIQVVMDGTNEDDLHAYRPGIQALKELGVASPLAMGHVTKAQVKELAAAYGISVAFRPSSPCMATRLPYGAEIDYQVLEKVEEGEEWLRGLVGGNVRLRLYTDLVRVEVDLPALAALIERRQEVLAKLKGLGFRYVTLDLEGFRSGSMDEGLEV